VKFSQICKTFAMFLALFAALNSSFAVEAKRGKVIDFDDEVVEGLNKRPLDSLSQISERDKKHKKPHLYRKRSGFRTEVAETLKTMPGTQ
jgi:hypothetical protein